MQEAGPQQFGDYHLLAKIATGGMAEVWRARAYGLAGFEKILVIKKVLDSLATDDEFIRRLRCEGLTPREDALLFRLERACDKPSEKLGQRGAQPSDTTWPQPLRPE